MGSRENQNVARLRRSSAWHGRLSVSGLLLDTNVFLWYAASDPKLSVRVADRIESETDSVYLSVISAWEIAIKVGLGKLELSLSLEDLVGPGLASHGVELLTLSADDVQSYAELGFPNPNHRDPFDRMLVVQSKRSRLELVTADESFRAYGIPILLN